MYNVQDATSIIAERKFSQAAHARILVRQLCLCKVIKARSKERFHEEL